MIHILFQTDYFAEEEFLIENPFVLSVLPYFLTPALIILPVAAFGVGNADSYSLFTIPLCKNF